MRATYSIARFVRGLNFLALGFGLIGWAHAQDVTQPSDNCNSWQHYDWLKPADDQKRIAASGESFHATVGQDVNNPFQVLSSGALWQEKYGSLYTRRLDEALTLSCETSSVVMSDDSEDLYRSQKMGFQFQPVQELTLRGNAHEAMSDAPIPSASTTTSGAGVSLESHLPTQTVLTFGANVDQTTTDAPTGLSSQTNTCDAELKQPIGDWPLSAVLKGHLEQTSTGGTAPTSLPSLEQSLVWKPLENTTLQMGLRQQQYQEYPGVDHQLNEALFADWSQKLLDNVSWHSYAEVLNSRGLIDQAPGAPLASGANGTPQATAPGSNPGLTSSLPVSLDDQTLTFSTGPSFRLQKDISASVEYSNRWDKEPAPGTIGQEQRVSVSIKGTF